MTKAPSPHPKHPPPHPRPSGIWHVLQVEGYSVPSVWAVVLGLAGLGLAFWRFYDPLKGAAQGAVERFGLPALFVLTWLMDAVIQPVPADVLVFGTTFGGAHLLSTAVAAGVGSALGGVSGFFIGKLIGPWRFKRLFGRRLLRGGRALFRDYGWWAIFVSGVTPIPYSAACYVGGIYRMPVMDVFVPSLIGRTGRYILFAWLGSLV